MKLQKRIAFISAGIAIIALGFAIWANYCSLDFVSNTLIGLFASSFLTLSVSITSYYSERSKALYELYKGTYDFMETLNSNLSPNNIVNLNDVKRNFSAMKSAYMKGVYANVSNLSAMQHSSKLYKIVLEIWEALRKLYLLICEDESEVMSFYMQDISLEEMKQYKFKYISDEAVNYAKDLIAGLGKLLDNRDFYGEKKKKSDPIIECYLSRQEKEAGCNRQ